MSLFGIVYGDLLACYGNEILETPDQSFMVLQVLIISHVSSLVSSPIDRLRSSEQG